MINLQGECLTGKSIAGGTYGDVFLMEGETGEYVAKRIYFDNSPPNFSSISNVLMECALVKLCSIVGIGPPFCFHMGFDLVLFESAIEFYMEKCTCLDHLMLSTGFLSLKARVRAMHMIHLFHKDIKPSNTLSSKQNGIILCDFGISVFIEERLGFKSYTKGMGTRKYMPEEMRRI